MTVFLKLSWVASNKDSNVHLLWVEGVRDYVQHATKLLDEYKDIVPLDGVTALQKAATDATSSQGRRAEGQSSATKAGSSKDERAVVFVRRVAGLNRQFAKWVSNSLETTPRMWWMEAAGDYVLHANRLLEDFGDIVSPDASTQPSRQPAAAAATGSGAAMAETEERDAAPSGLFISRSPAPASTTTGTPTPLAFGSAPFGGTSTGGLSGPAAAAAGSLFGAPGSQPSSGGKGTAPATGFMAAAPAAAASAASGAASGSSLFGSFAAPTVITATETDASTTTKPSTSTGMFGFSFGAVASTPASAAPSGKDATGGKPLATAAVPLSGIAGSSAAAKERTSGTADTAAAGDKLTAAAAAPPATSAPSAAAATVSGAGAGPPAVFGAGLFQFGAQPSSTPASTAAPAAPASTAGGGSSTAAAATTPSITFGAAPASTAAASSGSGNAGVPSGPVFGGSTAAAGGSTAPAFAFGSAPVTTGAATRSGPDGDAAKKDGGGGDITKNTGASGGDTAPALAAAPGGFSFFGASTAAPAAASGTAPSTGGFSFGSAAPGFSFGPKPAAAAPAAAAAADAEAEDNEPEQEPDECAKEPSLKVDDNVDFLFREKARLQLPVKGPDGKLSGWEAKAMGMLSIRKAKTEGAKPYIALFTDAAYIYKTMKLVVSDKQKSVAFSAMWSPDGTSPPRMSSALFQLAKTKNRTFEEVVLKLQEEMTE
ncbi:hypothetical protein VOLCADRAFT_88974 [Volvox carteri f. nagariensis]|uniref:RanBD1 domain-containing protein n=1 Tax=Volvox carteri f. nagariensis TaxID=3068 RepID=D8TQG5_VOLCA|nr:uncharacterized protein VOLCADRAFT_88974 [Volvox carteri f. nagariensis]EFJ50402.1 hypothetical protein VOLCADRAFT_88974 [Volvox carteri f. nagariensis]|eukprot:XP_002948527.1 hypothetical protein VOLCADRAFT_88974 [Volvox carteri f. nagariensis]